MDDLVRSVGVLTAVLNALTAGRSQDGGPRVSEMTVGSDAATAGFFRFVRR